MSKRGIIKRLDGSVSIVVPAPKALADGKTIEQLVERVLVEGETYDIVDSSAIPTNRYFRNAWRANGGNISVDIPTATDIKMAHIRRARDSELQDQDINFNQVQEQIETARIQIEDVTDSLKSLQNELLDPELDPLRKDEIDAEIVILNTEKATYKANLKAVKKDLVAVVQLKKQLRDIPQTTDLSQLDLERMEHYVPSELTHRDDVD